MIIKFLPNKGKGTCLATMNYLLGRNGDREHAKVLQGNPKLTQQLADSLDFKHKYTVGVLSFEENDLDDHQKREIMTDFEKALLCGLEQDQYNICWIEHRDKNRLELNFVIPKVELNTGKALNPYFDSVDRKRVNAFKDHTNAKYDLTDPNDPANRQPLTTKYNLPKDKKALQEAITGYLMNEMDQGRVTDRQSVLNALQSDLGLSVAKITPNAISIKDPINENGRNIRLKGEIYADTFRFSQNYSTENKRASLSYRANRTERISTTGAELAAEIERKRAFNSELYHRPRKELERANQQNLSLQNSNRGHNGLSSDDISYPSDSKPVFVQKHRQSTSTTSRDTTKHRADPTTSPSLSQSYDYSKQRQINLDNSQQPQKIRSRETRKQRQAIAKTGVADHQNSQINATESPFQSKNDITLPQPIIQTRSKTPLQSLRINTKAKMVPKYHPTLKSRLKRFYVRLNAIQQKRQDFLTNVQSILERLQRLANRTGTAIERLADNDYQTKRADRAINGSQSVLDSAERTITGANKQIDDTEQQIKQREWQANELIAEQQKALDKSKGFGFGR